MDNNIKETIRENRILTMSTNRTLDYLCVDAGVNITTIIGVMLTQKALLMLFLLRHYINKVFKI